MMSSGSTPYFSVSSLNDRSATCSLRARVTAFACCFLSSMDPTTRAARQRHDLLEAILAVFEIDRIDQRLARHALERLFDHAMIGRIDHQGHFDFFDFNFEKAGDIRHLVAIGILQAY